MTFIRNEYTNDKYLIGHSYDNYPIAYYSINTWLAAITLFPDYYIETPKSDNYSTFNINEYQNALAAFQGALLADEIILRNKLSMQVPKDNSVMLKRYCDNNITIVKQFLSGKDKIINSLLGIILKENKGTDPKSLLSELSAFIKLNYVLEDL